MHGYINVVVENIQKEKIKLWKITIEKSIMRMKLAKGKSISRIADEIEETEEKVLELIEQIKSE